MLVCVTIWSSASYLFTLIPWDDPIGNVDPCSCCTSQVHLAFSLPAGAVTYVDEEGDKVSLDSEGEWTITQQQNIEAESLLCLC